MKVIILSSLLILVINNSFAIEEIKTQNTKITNSEYIKTQSEYWNISYEEYENSRYLREQYKGLISTDITPLEILGINAKTDAERNKYAKLFAKKMRDTTARTLKFQDAYRKAYTELYGKEDMFNIQLSQNNKPIKRVRQDIDLKNCNTDCIKTAKDNINKSLMIPVDFYFKNATKQDIQKWAFAQKINREDVAFKRITLNFYKRKIK